MFTSKEIRNYTIRGLIYLAWTGFFGVLTLWYWFMSFGNIMTTYFWNVVGISSALLFEKWGIRRTYKKLALCKTDEARKKLSKKDVTSLKVSLYLFYILALIFSQVLDMNPYMNVSEDMRAYFRVVGHGLILLFAIDTFFKQLMDDDKRVKKFQKDCEGTKE